MKTILAFLMSSFLFGFVVHAQNSQAIMQTLKSNFKSASSNTSKSLIALEIAQKYLSTKDPSSTLYLDTAFKLLPGVRDSLVWSRYYGVKSLEQAKISNNKENAISYGFQSIKTAEQLHDSVKLKTIKEANLFLANTYREFDLKKEALEVLLKAELLKKTKTTSEIDSRILNNISEIYMLDRMYPISLEYAQKSLLFSKQSLDINTIARAYFSVGKMYRLSSKFDSAIYYLDTAFQITSANEKIVTLTKQGLLNDKAACLFNLKKFDELNKVASLQRNFAEQSKDTIAITAALITVSKVYQNKKNKDSAYFVLSEISKLSPSVKDPRYTMQFSLNEALIYESFSDYEKALQSRKKYWRISDSLKIQEANNGFDELTAKYQTAEKEIIISQQQLTIKNQQLLRLQSEKQAALAALKFDYEKKQLTAKSEVEKLVLKQEEAFKRLGIENDFKLNQANLIALQKNKDLSASLAAQKQAAQLKNQKFIGIGVITAFAFGSLWFLLYNRDNQRKLQNKLALQEAAQKLLEAEYNTKINNVTFDALRSQMNPHFIFNCLNSIKLYTEQNNKEVASAYLDKFSSLIRRVLDNARTEQITLNNEIESLRLYLDLESMRFKDKLIYEIKVDYSVDADYIEIPPMLLQPYVENAIWHGLMPKPEGGTIIIDFTVVNNVLQATVTDNGIGRTKSEAIKATKNRTHKGLGTQITHERIELINQRYKTNAQVVLSDVVDSNNDLLGTRATIQIPVI